ncbi:MAG: BREX-6 system BrxE protein [Myxococcales bacterium]|nr:BREX-6 system BrxE protein [Myxococcales bacterium]
MTNADATQARTERTPLPVSDIDLALTSQLVVAWAGETGEDNRLGWWRSDLVSEFGGGDLFQRLLPSTWRWAVLQGAREAARRTDAKLRHQNHNPDRIISLFSLGFELDERIEERLQELKRTRREPIEGLPGLAITKVWSEPDFFEWVHGHGDAEATVTSVGRRLTGAPPGDLGRLVRRLVSGLAPPAKSYPLPYFRREK